MKKPLRGDCLCFLGSNRKTREQSIQRRAERQFSRLGIQGVPDGVEVVGDDELPVVVVVVAAVLWS